MCSAQTNASRPVPGRERRLRALRQGLASSAWQLAVLALAGAAVAASWLPPQWSGLSSGSYAGA